MPSLKENSKCPKCHVDLDATFGYAVSDDGKSIVTCPKCGEKYVVYMVNGEFYWMPLPNHF